MHIEKHTHTHTHIHSSAPAILIAVGLGETKHRVSLYSLLVFIKYNSLSVLFLIDLTFERMIGGKGGPYKNATGSAHMSHSDNPVDFPRRHFDTASASIKCHE